ncbi:uncharacterized protein LOC120840848 [Ixodes scapularis]|uniref:uncharacterized protein LOC120840848 n=1 Tax=Ixodes scapularis TaxID=6945 RepID=UPI001A9D7915|nr:uncharacterized protein LOC120840848 [Ixodes scapularis]
MADQEDLQQQMKLLQEQIWTQQELIQRQQQQIQQQQHQLDGPVQQNPANANTTPPGVCRVAVKLPPFWADSPEVWFAQLEAQFSLARITQDRTRYDYVVANLDSRYANEIRDILDNLPAANLYQHLKTELNRRLSLSEDQKVRQLIQSAELAERKPSQFLRHMQVHDFFLRTLWLQRLPPHVQAILQAQPTLPLDQLAEIADRVIEDNVPPLSPTVHAVEAALDTTELAHRIDDITRQLSSIQRRLDQSPPTRPRYRSQSPDATTIGASGTEPDNADHPVPPDIRETPTAACGRGYELSTRRPPHLRHRSNHKAAVPCPLWL